MKADLTEYQKFVHKVTSDESDDLEALIVRMRELNETVNVAALLTGSTGLYSEGGEFAEIVKKCVFQGKPMDEDTVYHMKRELGDIIWYWITACRALGLDPNDVIQENVHKLEKRYPGGGFSVFNSENRRKGDI